MNEELSETLKQIIDKIDTLIDLFEMKTRVKKRRRRYR